jgi:hypothetical protein
MAIPRCIFPNDVTRYHTLTGSAADARCSFCGRLCAAEVPSRIPTLLMQSSHHTVRNPIAHLLVIHSPIAFSLYCVATLQVISVINFWAVLKNLVLQPDTTRLSVNSSVRCCYVLAGASRYLTYNFYYSSSRHLEYCTSCATNAKPCRSISP